MTAIRTAPSPFAQVPQGAGLNADKLAAQRAIFAQLAGTASPAASASVAAPARAAEPVVVQQAAPVIRRPTEQAPGQPTKYLRPGSIIDIRV